MKVKLAVLALIAASTLMFAGSAFAAGTIDANAGHCSGSTGACNAIYINSADFYQLAPGGGYYVHIGSGSGWYVDRYAPYNTSGFVSVCTNYGCKSHGFSGAGSQSFTVWF